MDNSVLDQNVMARASQSDHSPCVGHCTYDARDLCLSCRRHSDEIGAWRDADDVMRREVWARLPAAIDDAGVGVMRLPLSPDDIAALALNTLDEGGRWAVGGQTDADGQDVLDDQGVWAYAHDLTRDEDGVLTAQSEDGTAMITLDLSGKMRALAWARDTADGRPRKLADGLDDLPILIVVPRARIKNVPNTAPTMGDDGRLDLGHGLAEMTVLRDGDDIVLKTLLAEARISGAADPEVITNAVPQGLTLPESYVLAAIILPKGEADL